VVQQLMVNSSKTISSRSLREGNDVRMEKELREVEEMM
jgi:hypothetical protein